uniref:Uncharacterized protein n=1 Tax=Triticum urartu TaxID=4572 RepID=A0A8R7TS72_TRIUA
MQQGLQQQVNRRFRGDGRQGQALFAGRYCHIPASSAPRV